MALPCWARYRAPCIPFLTGCRQCGFPIKNARAYCSDRCRLIYEINHFWGTARAHAYLRLAPGYSLDGYLDGTWKPDRHEERACPKCSKRPLYSYEVNHIVPLNGERSHFSCAHHQTNLEAICHGCHVEITKQQRRDGLIGPPRPPKPLLDLLLNK